MIKPENAISTLTNMHSPTAVAIGRLTSSQVERIAALEAENTTLRTAFTENESENERLTTLVQELEAENARLRQNSERYEWLRANTQWMYPSSEGSDQKYAYLTVTGYGDCFHDPKACEIVDAAIDAARKP